MKKSGELELQILKQKEENLKNNLRRILVKRGSLQAEEEKTRESLSKIKETILNFGKKKEKEERLESQTSLAPSAQQTKKEFLLTLDPEILELLNPHSLTNPEVTLETLKIDVQNVLLQLKEVDI